MGSVGDQIRAARKARGMTQAALANAVGVTQGALTKWELGQNEPSLDKLARLSEVLGAPLGAIPIENIPSPPPLPPVEAVALGHGATATNGGDLAGQLAQIRADLADIKTLLIKLAAK